jgi:hypothetical protein
MRRISATVCTAALVGVSITALGTAIGTTLGTASASAGSDGPTRSERLIAATPHGVHAPTAGKAAPVRASGRDSLIGTVTSLPVNGFGDIVADPAHGHVFVSGGSGQNGVTVLDTSGVVQQTPSGLAGASGMVLSADGSHLYVALADGDAIGIVATDTLAVTTVPIGDSTCPTSVAETAGLVWFGYGCGGNAQQVGTLDPATSEIDLAVISTSNPVAIAASPQVPGVLMLATPDRSPDALTRYAVTGGATPAATATDTVDNIGGNFGDMAFTPDGADLVVADGGVYHHQIYSTADLSAVGSYTTTAYPNSVAINADGVVAAGIFGQYDPDIWLFNPDSSTSFRTFDFGDTDNVITAGGLAFVGTNIYAVTGGFGSPYRLHVVSTLPPSKALKVTTAKATYAYHAKVKVTVELKNPGNNQKVALYATPLGGQRVLVRKGSFSSGTFTATARVDRRTTFSAVWGGNATHGPTQRNTTVKVRAKVISRLRGFYKKKGRYALFHVSKNPKQIAAVLPNHAGDCLDFRVQKPTARGWKTYATTGCVALSTDSLAGAVLTGTHKVGERWRFQARWGGDAENLAEDGHWQYARFTR